MNGGKGRESMEVKNSERSVTAEKEGNGIGRQGMDGRVKDGVKERDRAVRGVQ